MRHLVYLAMGVLAVLPSAWGAPSGHAGAVARNDAGSNAALRAMLDAAAARKRAGTDVILRKDISLHGRPTADALNVEHLRAGTVVRRSDEKVTNAAGIWRHVNLADRDGGWVLDSELAE
ncbi:MAG: hypothetical protein E6R07_08855 [Nevskiaceae bacterium]|nr:MAG: hypothetical protein E6R07_08855 [Nevskiaceae bacterium]